MTGNSQNGGTCIELIEFPEHNYYPQKLTIKVYCSELGSQYTARHTLTLYDCEHDDPTCDEYYEENLYILPDDHIEFTSQKYDLFDSHDEPSSPNKRNNLFNNYYLEVYLITGQLVYSGCDNYFNWDILPLGQLYIVARYDNARNLVHLEKNLNID